MRANIGKVAIFLALAGPALAKEPAAAPATVQPTRPERPTLPVVAATDCQDVTRRGALLADPMPIVDAVTSYGRALNAYGQALNQWRSDQLTRSGRWSAENRQHFAMRILDHPEIQRGLEANFGLVGEMMEHSLLIGDARKPPLERCRSLVAIQGYFDRITASVETQWQLIDRMFAQEAVRIGVTLD